jgi:hypothetical protein
VPIGSPCSFFAVTSGSTHPPCRFEPWQPDLLGELAGSNAHEERRGDGKINAKTDLSLGLEHSLMSGKAFRDRGAEPHAAVSDAEPVAEDKTYGCRLV